LWLFITLLCLLPLPVLAQTPTHHVAKTGCSDAGTGVIGGTPWCTVQRALSATCPAAGSVVLVHAGTYVERVTPTCSGAAGQPITIMGEKDVSGNLVTKLDGSDQYTGSWSLWQNSGSTSIWKMNTPPGYTIGQMGQDDGHIFHMGYYGCTMAGPCNVPNPDPAWPRVMTAMSYGPDERVYMSAQPNVYVKYWDAWAALWGGDGTGGFPYVVRYRNGDNPTGKNMRMAPTGSATVMLGAVHHLTFKALKVQGGHWQFRLNTGANDITIQDSELINGVAQISINGPQRLKVLNNLIHGQRVPTGNTYGPGPMVLPCCVAAWSPAEGTYQYRAGVAGAYNWLLKTRYSTVSGSGSMGIDMYNGNPGSLGCDGCEIGGNRMWDNATTNMWNYRATNIKIHHNDISQTSDAGLFAFPPMTGEIYDNVFHDDAVNFRFSFDTSGDQEVFVYRNTFRNIDQPAGRHILWCCESPNNPDANQKFYWYHNSFLGGISYDGTFMTIAHVDYSKRQFFFNNVFSTNFLFVWDTGNYNAGVGLPGYNWFGGKLGTTYTRPPKVAPLGLVIGPNSIQAFGQQQWDFLQPTNFVLPTNSPARNAGIDVTNAALMVPFIGRTMPGFSPGYFTGAKPHMGAVQDIDNTTPPPEVPAHLAFPGAEGFGRFAFGGRGGKAMNVNSTAGGAGSTMTCTAGGCSATTLTLQDCLTANFPRTCIFKVGGKFDAPCGAAGCVITNPYLTIAGQTAPGGGVMIASSASGPGQLTFRARDIIVRHIRVRPGKAQATAGGILVDTVGADDIIFDHVSTGWQPVDGPSMSHVQDITWQWSIISEALGTSVSAPAGCGLWAPGALTGSRGLSVLHSMIVNQWHHCYAHFDGGNLQAVNNVYYNNVEGGYMAATTTTPLLAMYINNVYKVGPQSNTVNYPNYPRLSALGCSYAGWINCSANNLSSAFVSGNIHTVLRPSAASGAETAVLDFAGTPNFPTTSTPPDFPPLTTVVPASQVLNETMLKAGAYAVADGVYSTVRRDSIDARAVSDVNSGTPSVGTAGVANAVDETTLPGGGYPSYAAGTAPTDTDGDGMPDAWEDAHPELVLSKTDPSDGPQIISGGPYDGYSKLEVYLNEIASEGAPVVPPAPETPVQVLRRLVR